MSIPTLTRPKADTAVAKPSRKPPQKTDEKRGRGRPSKDVETASFTCRAPLTMGLAFTRLAKITGSTKPGTELLRAAEDHLLRMYRLIRDNPDSQLIRDLTGNGVSSFLAAVEAYLKEMSMWPLAEDS